MDHYLTTKEHINLGVYLQNALAEQEPCVNTAVETESFANALRDG